MEVVVYLIPPTLILAGIIIGAFFWSLKNNQYDDLESSGQRMLHQDERNSKQK